METKKENKFDIIKADSAMLTPELILPFFLFHRAISLMFLLFYVYKYISSYSQKNFGNFTGKQLC